MHMLPAPACLRNHCECFSSDAGSLRFHAQGILCILWTGVRSPLGLSGPGTRAARLAFGQPMALLAWRRLMWLGLADGGKHCRSYGGPFSLNGDQQ